MEESIDKMDAQTLNYTIKIREAFDLFDSDHSEMISKKEVFPN